MASRGARDVDRLIPVDDAPDDPTAGWKADPRGEARRRYWDGTVWTSLVSDQGQHLAPQVNGVVIPLAAGLLARSTERLVVDDARIALHVDALLDPLIVGRAEVRGMCVGGGAPRIAAPPRDLNLPNVMTRSHDHGNLTVVFRTPQPWPRVAMSMRINHPPRRAIRSTGIACAWATSTPRAPRSCAWGSPSPTPCKTSSGADESTRAGQDPLPYGRVMISRKWPSGSSQ